MKRLTPQQESAAHRALFALHRMHWKEGGEKARPRVVRKLKAQILTLVGADGPCYMLDPDLWSLYSDCHKDRYGFRPRGSLSVTWCEQELKDWADRGAL
jgi:hypothetical protein